MNKNYETGNCTAHDSVNNDDDDDEAIANAMTSLAYHCSALRSQLLFANIMNHEGCETQQNMSIEIIWFSMCKKYRKAFFSFLCVPLNMFVYIFVYIFMQRISNIFHYTNQLSFYRRAIKTRSKITGERRERII